MERLLRVDGDRILSVRRLADGSEAPISASWVHSDYPELAFADLGPDAAGRFPAEALAILKEIGGWMEKNGDSVYGCGPAGPDKPEWGRYTRNGDRLYVHIFENTVGPLPLFGVDRDRILSVRRLSDGSEALISASWVHSDYPELAFADLGPDPVLPDPVDTVLEVRLK